MFGGVQADVGGVGAAGVREGLQHRRAERPQRRQGQDLRHRPPTPRSPRARPRTPAGRACVLRAKHAVFDRLVYSKLRAALGGDCHAAISGGAPLGARLGHFYRGVGFTIYEGYGLTETSAAITVNPRDDMKIGTVGKPLPGNSRAHRRRRRGAGARRAWCSAATGTTRRRPRRRSPTAGSTPATSARSTMTASCPSPAARRRSSSPPAARTSPPPSSRTELRAHPLISQAWSSATPSRSSAALITIDPEAFCAAGSSATARTAGASVGDLAADPDLLAEIDTRRRERQPGGLQGRVDPQVPHPAGGFHRGHRRADADAEGQAQGGGPEVRHRDRSALREGLTAAAGLAPGVAAWVRQLPVRDSTQRGPRAHRRGPVGVGKDVADRRGDRADVPAVDDQAGLAVAHRFRRATGVGPPRPARPSRTPPGRRCPGPRRPGRRRGCGTASRTHPPSRGGRAARHRAPPSVNTTSSATP